MKRPKHKIFKRHIDLIRYAVKRAIHRVDVLEPEKHVERLKKRMKKNNWLHWAAARVKEKR